MKIRTNIKEIRLFRGLTQAEVAAAIGCSISAYSKYELGIREPSISALIEIADCFNVSVDELLGHIPMSERGDLMQIEIGGDDKDNDSIMAYETDEIMELAHLKKKIDCSIAQQAGSDIVSKSIKRFSDMEDCVSITDAYREIKFLNTITGTNIDLLCKAMGVSRSGYYHFDKYGDAVRNRNEKIAREIEKYEFAALDSSGYKAVTMYLRKLDSMPELKNISVGRVKRIMDEFEIIPEDLRSKKNQIIQIAVGKYDAEKELVAHPDKLKHRFAYDVDPLVFWCIDITEIKTDERKLYLCAVIDLCGRYLVGYAMGITMNRTLVRRAISDAEDKLMKYGREDIEPTVIHSDRGTQFKAKETCDHIKKQGFDQSMSRPHCPNDNACIESFFSSLKNEYLYRFNLTSVEIAKRMVRRYIKFYNEIRVHETVGEAPMDYWLSRMM